MFISRAIINNFLISILLVRIGIKIVETQIPKYGKFPNKAN